MKPPRTKKPNPLISQKPKRGCYCTPTVPVLVLPEPKGEGFDFADDNYSPLSTSMLEATLKEDEMMVLVLKDLWMQF